MNIKDFGEQKWEAPIESLAGYSPRELFNDNQDAYEVALIFIRACNIWDDIVDADQAVTTAEIHYSYTSQIHDLQRNTFYNQFRPELFAMHMNAVMAWLAANEYEDMKDERGIELGYTLRYGVVQAVCYIIYLAHDGDFAKGVEFYPIVMKGLCQEPFDEYKAEIMTRGEKQVA